jgi:hypothetical protein
MGPPHLLATRHKRTTTVATTHKETPPTDHHHCHKLRWVSRCSAPKKGTTPMAPSPHIHIGLGFHPGIPV